MALVEPRLMGVDAIALMGHGLVPNEMKGLAERLKVQTGEDWTWEDDYDFGLSPVRFWASYERLCLNCPHLTLYLGPRSAQLSLASRLSAYQYFPEEREPALENCRQVCSVLESPSVAVIPDSAFALSEACCWEDWSHSEILQGLQKLGSQVEGFEQMFTETEEYTEYVGYPLFHFQSTKPPEPPKLSGDRPHFESPDLIQSFSFSDFTFNQYSSRLHLRGSVHFDFPDDRVFLYNNYSQDAELLLLAVCAFRYNDTVKPTQEGQLLTESEWLASYIAERPHYDGTLKHYCIGHSDSVLEVLAISHFLKLQTRGGDAPNMSVRYQSNPASPPHGSRP